MDENTQQRIWRALDDAMQLLEQSPEKFAGIVLTFAGTSENGDVMELSGTSLVWGHAEVIRQAKAELDAAFESYGYVDD